MEHTRKTNSEWVRFDSQKAIELVAMFSAREDEECQAVLRPLFPPENEDSKLNRHQKEWRKALLDSGWGSQAPEIQRARPLMEHVPVEVLPRVQSQPAQE